MPRDKPREARVRVSTEDMILETAEALFARHGYDGVSTKQLAAAAGVTIGALYHYFSSKEELYDRVRTHIFTGKQLFPENFPGEGTNAEERLERLVATFIGNITEDANFGLLLQREFLNPDSEMADRLLKKHFRQSYAAFRETLQELLPDADHELALASLLALCLGFANLKGIYTIAPGIRATLETPDAIARHVTGLLLNGMAGAAASV